MFIFFPIISLELILISWSSFKLDAQINSDREPLNIAVYFSQMRAVENMLREQVLIRRPCFS